MIVNKRNGNTEKFNVDKAFESIKKASNSIGFVFTDEQTNAIKNGIEAVATAFGRNKNISVELILDTIVYVLKDGGFLTVAESFSKHRELKKMQREVFKKLINDVSSIDSFNSKNVDLMRENANVNGDTAMGQMLRVGSETKKAYHLTTSIDPEFAKAHIEGDIHIHDLDFYSMTTTCCQIDLEKLFQKGFDTGHGSIRPPQSIKTASNLACIVIQANQNEQHGGQSIPNFDRFMAPYVNKSFVKYYFESNYFYLTEVDPELAEVYKERSKKEPIQDFCFKEKLENAFDCKYIETETQYLLELLTIGKSLVQNIQRKSIGNAIEKTKNETYQAMEALVHNLNTLHSRAGSQVPFSSINFGTDTSDSGRLVAISLLNAQLAGLGNGETPIFPILIYRLKEGVNYNENDPNYDIFQLAMRTSSVRMFPNFSFQDAPFNLQYYDKDKPETEISYMGCRTRVIGNEYDPARKISYSRGNISFTSINLPRLAILYKQNNPNKDANEITRDFCENYIRPKLELVKNQLLERFKYQGSRTKENFPFLMKEGIWLDSEILEKGEPIARVLRHGTFSIGFIGLAETLKELFGVHHGESDFAQEQGLRIVKYMRDYCDKTSYEMKLNFSLLATPAEGLCLEGNTLVQTPKGYVPIKDLKEGDYLFSFNETTCRYELDQIEKSGKTKRDKKCVVTFDTGQKVVCTKDHPFAVKLRYKNAHGRACKIDGKAEYVEWRQANELTPGDRIKSCYIRNKKEGYLADSINDRYIHLTVMEGLLGKEIPSNRNVHHIDLNKSNNDPSNLKLLTSLEHKKFHKASPLDGFKYGKKKNIKGENNPFYGKHFTPEMKQKARETKQGIKRLEQIEDAVLLKEFRESEKYEEIAAKYGVSLNSYYVWINKLLDFEKGVEPNHSVVSVEFFDEEIDFYDITTKKNHNFFVGGRQGILVHNSGRFTRLDKKMFGIIEGVTDKEFYTNSFHVPVDYDITCYSKIKKEAPYHALTNAGHISYVEFDGDAAQNLKAFEKVVRCMHDEGIGYGAINHPIDYDPNCGYRGVINGKICPKCGRTETEENPFERVRRITGYLVGTLDRFNNAKRAEEKSRVKHGR